MGVTLGWTSPVNPKLTEVTLSDNPLGRIPDSEEISWIGALVALGALIGNSVFFLLFLLETPS